MKLTRHNGRAGKNGAYNPKHNDRRFDIENSEHIDVERARQNIYWDCYTGLSSALLMIQCDVGHWGRVIFNAVFMQVYLSVQRDKTDCDIVGGKMTAERVRIIL